MVKEELESILEPLENTPGFYGYSILKDEGVTVHSKFKSTRTNFKKTTMQLNKIYSAFKDAGKTFGDKETKYSLFELKKDIILVAPLNQDISVALFLQKGSDINQAYKQIYSLKNDILRVI